MPLVTELNDDALTEVLLRLPPKSVLRSRAVCKRWRRAASCDSFLAAYSSRQPLELIRYPDLDMCTRKKGIVDVDAVPLDGLLLFAQGCRRLVVCNPTTGRCARFMAQNTSIVPSGFYLHRPSGGHRVLYFTDEITPVHYVWSTGAARQRRLGPFAGYRPFALARLFPPCGVDIGGTLHWARTSTMLSFDTESETFRQMPLPPADNDNLMNLFDMCGTLAASAPVEWPYMDVWALDDYDAGRWSRRFRVELPATAMGPSGDKWGAAVAALKGDVLVLFAVGGWVTLYDVKEKRTVRVVHPGDHRVDMCWCVHRESLAPAVIHGLSGVVHPHHAFLLRNLVRGQNAPTISYF